MIAAIEGILQLQGDDWAIIKIDGVSLKVHLPTSTLSKLTAGGKVHLYTHLQLREDNVALYGFASQEELDLFKMLIGVDGVSPRVALVMLSALSPEQISLAIASGNVDILTQVPGIGRKTANHLVLELKSRLEKSWAGVSPSYLTQTNADVIAALTNLGYSAQEASQATAALPQSPDLSLEEKIKLALRHLTR